MLTDLKTASELCVFLGCLQHSQITLVASLEILGNQVNDACAQEYLSFVTCEATLSRLRGRTSTVVPKLSWEPWFDPVLWTKETQSVTSYIAWQPT